MKKIPKNLLGILGLLLVIATTIFAAFLPTPEASATTSSVTDTIVVRVVGNSPRVEIVEPEDKSVYVEPEHTIKYNYENVNKVTPTITYIDQYGVTHTVSLPPFYPTDEYGSSEFYLDLSGDEFDYGEYTVTLVGEGNDGVTSESSIAFSYYPVTTSIENNKETGEVFAILNYDLDNEEIKTLVIEVYDENGNLITPLSPITVESGTIKVELPLTKYGIPEGKYVVKTTAYGEDNRRLYLPYDANMIHEIIIIPVPDTGGLTNNLNISKTDFLITGLLAFFIVGGAGLFFVAKKKNR